MGTVSARNPFTSSECSCTEPVSSASRCSTSAGCGCCASWPRAARSRPSPRRSPTRRRRSPSSSPRSSATPACRCSSASAAACSSRRPATGWSAHADAVLARLEAAEADLARAAGAVAGRVRSRRFQTAAHALVVPALGPLEERHPELRVRARAGRGRERAAGAAARRRRPRDRRGVRPRAAPARPGARAPRPVPRRARVRGPGRPPGGASRRRSPSPTCAGDEWAGGETRHRLERHDRARLPLDRRLRARHPPQRRRRAADPRARGRRAAPSGSCPRSGCTTRSRASSGARRPRAPLDRRIFTAVRRGTAERPALRRCARRSPSRRAGSGCETPPQ